LKPQNEITKDLKANMLLMPGNTGADDNLPAYYANGIITTRWKLSWKERLAVLFKGSIWLNVMSGTHPPVRIDAEAPFEVIKTNIPWGMDQVRPAPRQEPMEGIDKLGVEEDNPVRDEKDSSKENEEMGFYS